MNKKRYRQLRKEFISLNGEFSKPLFRSFKKLWLKARRYS